MGHLVGSRLIVLVLYLSLNAAFQFLLVERQSRDKHNYGGFEVISGEDEISQQRELQ